MNIIAYYVFMNVILFLFMRIDKNRAIANKWRVSERTLLMLSAVGGCIGGYIAMFAFRHKVRKFYFHLVFITSILFHSLCIILFIKFF